MSLEESVALALQQNPDVLTKDAEVAEAEAAKGGASGRFGPRLHVDANFQQWNGPFDIAVNLGPAGSAPANFPVRNAFTYLASVSLIQPLSGLWPIYENYKLRDLGIDVATVHRQATRRDVAFQVTEAYLRTVETVRLSEVAAASVDQLNAQLKESQSLYANGVVSQTDVLRAQVAVANARQRVIQLRGQQTIARANLAAAMGMPAGAAIEPRAAIGRPASARGHDHRRSRAARRRRPRRAARDRQATRAGREGRTRGSGAPCFRTSTSSAITRTMGGSEFVQPDAAYVGATASWDVWDWGATLNGIGEAKARTAQVLAARTKVDQMVRLDVRQAYVDVETTADGMDVARTAVRSGRGELSLDHQALRGGVGHRV
jgi:outer membrane protein